MRLTLEHFDSLISLANHFNSDKRCRDFITEQRWGKVEIDEMYLGGRETNKHESKKTEKTQGRSTKTKTPIFGMVARKGEARAVVVPNTQAAILMPIIKQFGAYLSHSFISPATNPISCPSSTQKRQADRIETRNCGKIGGIDL